MAYNNLKSHARHLSWQAALMEKISAQLTGTFCGLLGVFDRRKHMHVWMCVCVSLCLDVGM